MGRSGRSWRRGWSMTAAALGGGCIHRGLSLGQLASRGEERIWIAVLVPALCTLRASSLEE